MTRRHVIPAAVLGVFAGLAAVVAQPREPGPAPRVVRAVDHAGNRFIEPAGADLGDVEVKTIQAGQFFRLCGDWRSEAVWMLVQPPLPDTAVHLDGSKDETFGIAYQPTRDGNSVYAVHVKTGMLYRMLGRLRAERVRGVTVVERVSGE